MLQQSSVIPYRRNGQSLEFCLITSLRKGLWGFPKGIIDPGETYVETAIKEVHEEAGLTGRIHGSPLGSYEYAKWGTRLAVTVVLMEVTRCDDEWDESDVRERRWVGLSEAKVLLSRVALHELLDKAVARLAS